jgi:hypothetical protein
MHERRWDVVRDDFVRVRKGPLSVGEYEKIHKRSSLGVLEAPWLGQCGQRRPFFQGIDDSLVVSEGDCFWSH